MSDLYDVVFEGRIDPGKKLERVKSRLRSSLQVDEERLERLFSGQSITIRKGVDLDTAEKYKKVFLRAGALCDIRPATAVEFTAETVRPPEVPPRRETQAADQAGTEIKTHYVSTPGGGKMIITNIETVPGKTVVVHYGLVSGSTIRAKHIGRDFMASLKNLVGGELKGYTELLKESRQQAIDRMVTQASQMGANAIVNVRFSTSSVAQGAAELYAYGTAVRVE